MTDRPIIFSAPMVRALLDGRKTQTRRVLKPQPPAWATFCQQLQMLNVRQEWVPSGLWQWCEPETNPPRSLRRWPVHETGPMAGDHYGLRPRYVPGDRLWVRESCFYANGSANWLYRADGENLKDRIGTSYPSELRWTPSIHMPRRASRLTLHVKGVKVERLQDISAADAIAEGATRKPRCYGYGNLYDGWSMDWKEPAADYALVSASMAFGSFINELHGGPRWSSKPGPSLWDSNPWVVAVTFRVVRANIYSPEARAE